MTTMQMTTRRLARSFRATRRKLAGRAAPLLAGVLTAGLIAAVPAQAAPVPLPQPRAGAPDPLTRVYVADSGSGSVSVFDAATPSAAVFGVASPRTAVLGAPVPMADPWAVAASPDGSRVYITDKNTDTLEVLSTSTNTVMATIHVGRGPQAVAVSPDGRTAWTADAISGTVSVIDTADETVEGTVRVGGVPDALAVGPDGRRVYVGVGLSDEVAVIDAKNHTVLTTIAVDDEPGGVAITPDGGSAYVTLHNGTVAVINTEDGRVLRGPIEVGKDPSGVAFDPSGSHAYVANGGSGDVTVINTRHRIRELAIRVGALPTGVAVDPDGAHVYVTDAHSGKVAEIDTESERVTDQIPVGGSPRGVAIARLPQPGSYLDQIQDYVRAASPGLEHVAWERTAGNLLDDDLGAKDWVLQTPQCWGTNPCPPTARPGTDLLLQKMEDNIAAAKATVDMTSLGCPNAPGSPCGTYPEGAFRNAIVNGLKTAAGNHPITFRLLMGAPALPFAAGGDKWIKALRKEIGTTAHHLDISVGIMTTSEAYLFAGGATPSWNHSKLLVVDGKTLIEGGVNTYQKPYIDTPKPVTDMMMAVRGPAAGSATEYLDKLWEWSCDHQRTKGHPSTGAWVYPKGSQCIRTLPTQQASPAGHTDMLEVGGLGVGIQQVDPDSHYRLSVLTNPDDAKCDLRGPDKDVVNSDRDYQTVNPEETALRAMVATATRSIVFSQQDLYGWCAQISFPVSARQPLGDLRLLDQVAAKMIQGVKVRIVISTPGNEDSYSTMKDMAQLSDLIRKRIEWQVGGDPAKAEEVMDDTLQYASLRSSSDARWLGNEPLNSKIKCDKPKVACSYAQHTKLVVVDDSVFYLGSKNAYPAFLQDDGYFVEDPVAVAHLEAVFLNPQWDYSKADATYDWERFHAQARNRGSGSAASCCQPGRCSVPS